MRAAIPWTLVMAAGLGACSDSPGSGGTKGSPDVLIVLVDTLRADHLGTYGYERETDPSLAAFARDAIRFANAYAPSSWTKPSTASLLTGLAPRVHGAVTGADRLAADVTLLSERLADAGYRTAAWTANPNVLDVWGFAQGFEVFEDLAGEELEATAGEFLAAWRERRRSEGTAGPTFHYLHTMEPHHPYAPPAERESEGWPFRPERVLKPIQITPQTRGDDLRDTINAYDSEIAYSDEVFGRMLDDLRADGRYDDTLIVYVSDHGEEFGDHGRGGHQRTLFEEVVRVPLLVKLPGSRLGGRTVEARASLLDVVPTVLAAAGLETGPELGGVDLALLVAGADDARPLFFDLDREGVGGQPNFVQQAVLAGRWKLIRGTSPEPFQRLYDLDEDPGETRDVASENLDVVAALSRRLDAESMAGASGFHLIVENTPRAGVERVEARLSTSGRFVEVSGTGLEEADAFELSDDGRTLDVHLVLENVPNPAGTVPRTLIDVDGVRFELEPEDATLTLEEWPVREAGARLVRLGLAVTDRPPPFELTAPRTELAARPIDLLALRSSDPSLRPRSTRATLLYLRPPQAVASDAALDERLKHFGYGGEEE